MKPDYTPVPWRVRIAFGIGQLPEGIKSAAFGFFLLFYYNQVLGLSGTLSGIAIFLALIVDAISDPMVGALSDSTRSRWGRRHPYMYAAAIPFAASFYFLFAPPAGLTEMGLFLVADHFLYCHQNLYDFLLSTPYVPGGRVNQRL